MHYTVTKQYGTGREATLQKFFKLDEAEKFVQKNLAEDVRFKVDTTYRIYDDLDKLIKIVTHADAEQTTPSGQSASTSGQSKTQSFNPTPFAMSPNLGPRSWIKDTNKDEDKDK
jgi:uncharacterized protein YdaU (DUF1376 family)